MMTYPKTYREFAQAVLDAGLEPSRNCEMSNVWFIQGGEIEVLFSNSLGFRTWAGCWKRGTLADAIALARQSPMEAKIQEAAKQIVNTTLPSKIDRWELIVADILRRHFGENSK